MQPRPRIIKMAIGPLGLNHLHRRNPWVALAWSVALPGLGHVYCHALIKGFILISWEILVNHLGRINQAIYLTVLGHPDKARLILDYRWAPVYPIFYMLAIWDSYRLAVELNRLCTLEEQQPVRQFASMLMTPYDTVFLNRRNPWLAAFFSLFLGGAGHFYNCRLVKALILMGWHLAVWLKSGLNLALIATLQGNWAEVHALIDYQWLLFLPSIHLFNIWSAYSDCVETNKLHAEEQAYARRQNTEHKPVTTGPPPCES